MTYNEILSEHTIVKVTNRYIYARYPRLYGKNSRLPEHQYGRDFYAIEIVTDKGAMGWGHNKCTDKVKAMLIGKKVSEVFDPMIGTLLPSGDLNVVDTALHDLAGNILGISVAQMIAEGRGKTAADNLKTVDCYDGAIYMNDISPDSHPGGVEEIIRNCRYDWDVLGFRSFKVKVGRGGMWMEHDEGLRRDIEVMHEIKKNFPNARLLADANDKFSTEDACKFIEACKDLDLYWIEEPFKETADDLKRLREAITKYSPNTLIADGEFEPNVPQVIRYAEDKLLDVLLMDTVWYAITPWRSLLTRLANEGILASPHNWPLKVKTHYSAHIAAAFPDVIPTIEGVPDETQGVDFACYELKDGRIAVPDKPGFGMELIYAPERN